MNEYAIHRNIGIIVDSMHQTFTRRRLAELDSQAFKVWFRESYAAFDYNEMLICMAWALEHPEYPFREIPPGETRFSQEEILEYIKIIYDKLTNQSGKLIFRVMTRKQILEYLSAKGDMSLTYHNLDRKLLDDNLFYLIPGLRDVLNELVESGELDVSQVNDGVEYYSLTEKGKTAIL